jgi:hypothetical protein
MGKILSGRFPYFRQFCPRTLYGLELISRLEAEAKERQREGGVEGGEIAGRGRPKENRLSQLIDEAYDDKNVGKVTHHLARVFSTNRQYVCDAKLLVERALRVKEGLGKPSRRERRMRRYAVVVSQKKSWF